MLGRFHPEVLAELAAPVEEVRGQDDGAGEIGLLGHPVGLQYVGPDRLVRQEGKSQTRELKFQELIFYTVCFKPALQTAHRNAFDWLVSSVVGTRLGLAIL